MLHHSYWLIDIKWIFEICKGKKIVYNFTYPEFKFPSKTHVLRKYLFIKKKYKETNFTMFYSIGISHLTFIMVRIIKCSMIIVHCWISEIHDANSTPQILTFILIHSEETVSLKLIENRIRVLYAHLKNREVYLLSVSGMYTIKWLFGQIKKSESCWKIGLNHRLSPGFGWLVLYKLFVYFYIYTVQLILWIHQLNNGPTKMPVVPQTFFQSW